MASTSSVRSSLPNASDRHLLVLGDASEVQREGRLSTQRVKHFDRVVAEALSIIRAYPLLDIYLPGQIEGTATPRHIAHPHAPLSCGGLAYTELSRFDIS